MSNLTSCCESAARPAAAQRIDGVAGGCNLGERQREFATAILNPDDPIPRNLVGPDGEPSVKRFAVYRNNVVAGLVEVLKAAFPVVRRIVGEEFFAAMARIYVTRDPPRSPIMLDYGARFADFVGAFKPAAELPYLRDVARLERAWLEAYHAAEARPIGPAEFMEIGSSELPHISFVLHPSLRVVRSSFPILAIWRMNIDGNEPTVVAIESGGEDVLIVRPDAEVEMRLMSSGAAVFTRALAAGSSVVDAATVACRDHAGFDLANALEGLVGAGLVVGWSLNESGRSNATGRST